MVLEDHMVLWQLDFLKNSFAVKNGENTPSLGFFKYTENIVIIFSINLVYNGSLY